MKRAEQLPQYDDAELFTSCIAALSRKPPIVARGEIDRLRTEIAEAAAGRRFILQGGDCAERFKDCTAKVLKRKLQVLLQMSMVLTYATRKPVTRIGRLAGQYAKPRSANEETVGTRKMPVYRGDLVNGYDAGDEARRPNPTRMLEGYYHATASLNYIRALIEGGFADLHHPEQWDLEFLEKSPEGDSYRRIADAITDAIHFMDTVGATDVAEKLRRIAFYTSHEALLLPYEEALTRMDDNETAYNLGAHYLWLGYRTCTLDGAHVEYLRGIENPIGIKVGPGLDSHTLLALLAVLDPRKTPGRITLITRFGANTVRKSLPSVINSVQKAGHPVLWCCDPMHGNTETASDGRKTRRTANIFSEIEQTFAIHGDSHSCLGGVHFELTGDVVTECIGNNEEQDLCGRYDTACDPRLNAEQSLEMAFLIARLLR